MYFLSNIRYRLFLMLVLIWISMWIRICILMWVLMWILIWGGVGLRFRGSRLALVGEGPGRCLRCLCWRNR